MNRKKIYASFDGSQSIKNISTLCIELLEEQKKTWPELKDAHEYLKHIKVRDIQCNGYSVKIQHNLKRAKSSTASCDIAQINSRQCFLCIENLPKAQRGILYRDEYLILCNPAPVFPNHLTISNLKHIPQGIAKNINILIQLSQDLGPDWLILYNGPKCGASAPDHLHFQAIPRGHTPVEKDLQDKDKFVLSAQSEGVSIYKSKDIGREIIIFEGVDKDAIAGVFKSFLEALRSVVKTEDEPMINILCFVEGGKWYILVFPRAKHRPEAFFRDDDEKITVSPAVIEMAGVIITPFERDFLRLDASKVEAIYREVSLDGNKLKCTLKYLPV
ncbi:MAG TPA: DUF4922 domain-containing protein [Syntrophorhabdaceae bacterium]|nr:DUF4922 domain-containing protein [Syntrophorhabdaceae bacterium]